MCTKYRVKYVCSKEDAGHYVKSQCEDLVEAHLHHREGRVTVSEDHKLMDKDLKSTHASMQALQGRRRWPQCTLL